MKHSYLPPNDDAQSEANILSRVPAPEDFEDGLMQRITLAKLPTASELQDPDNSFSEEFESGVFTRVLMRSLAVAHVPHDFENRVMERLHEKEERQLDLRIHKFVMDR